MLLRLISAVAVMVVAIGATTLVGGVAAGQQPLLEATASDISVSCRHNNCLQFAGNKHGIWPLEGEFIIWNGTVNNPEPVYKGPWAFLYCTEYKYFVCNGDWVVSAPPVHSPRLNEKFYYATNNYTSTCPVDVGRAWQVLDTVGSNGIHIYQEVDGLTLVECTATSSDSTSSASAIFLPIFHVLHTASVFGLVSLFHFILSSTSTFM